MKLKTVLEYLLGDEPIPKSQEEKYEFLCDYFKCPKAKRTFSEKHYKKLKKRLKKEVQKAMK